MSTILCTLLFLVFASLITKYTIVFLVFMALLFKFTEADKWWLWFVIIMVLLVKAGYQPGIIALAVIMIIFKIVKDVCTSE
jgi:hypothetical protein